MAKTERKLLTAIERYMDFNAEKKLLQATLHAFHDVAGNLDRALKTSSVTAIAGEEKDFHRQEKKLHLQSDHFERALDRYAKSLVAARTLVKRSLRVSHHGVTYQFIRKGMELTVTGH